MERDKITTNADTGQVAQPDAKHLLSAVCSWCGEQIFIEQPISKSYDGETMHFGCAAECDDADIGDCSF